MNKKINLVLIFIYCIISSHVLCGQSVAHDDFEDSSTFQKWKVQFKDRGNKNWNSKWFLDGEQANVTNSSKGMLFSAGSTVFDDACHAVLWTKDFFEGDIKIEYEYTRTDTETSQVNILYIQASGIGQAPYAEDISEWNDLRRIPSMKTYFNNMNALHISYAAFGQENKDELQDYIRVRKYPRLPGNNFSKTTEVPPSYFQTNLFETGKTYKITVVKTRKRLFFKVEGKGISKLYSWDLKEGQSVQKGRIGLRHMYTRSARYKNFTISTR